MKSPIPVVAIRDTREPEDVIASLFAHLRQFADDCPDRPVEIHIHVNVASGGGATVNFGHIEEK